MKKRDELIFWFDQPPQVSKGAFNYVSENWGNKVLFIVDHKFPEHRRQIGWDDGNYGLAEIIYLSDQENQDEFIKNIFIQYPNAIHILNGFFSNTESKIRKYVKNKNVKLIVHTEKPLVSRWDFSLKKFFMNRFLPIKYKKNYRTYKEYVNAVITLGVRGKEVFESFGWAPEKVFSYMYCPILRDVGQLPEITTSSPMRFLYVGRLNYATRGLDTLIKALDMLESDNYMLDIVGGYGDNKDEIIAWAQAHPKVNFMGLWPADEMGIRMKEYDVYVVPTKSDGWNSQINEALHAGIGLITTDEAISDELVSASDAGIVVKASDPNQFSKAIMTAIENPQLVETWKLKARDYRHRIALERVGDYFIDILDYLFYEKQERPICPWL